VLTNGTFIGRESSSGKAREPSHPPDGKQSWNTALIAARASSLHWPSERNMEVSSLEIVDHTVGQLLRRTKGETDGKEMACADTAKAKIATGGEKYMMRR